MTDACTTDISSGVEPEASFVEENTTKDQAEADAAQSPRKQMRSAIGGLLKHGPHFGDSAPNHQHGIAAATAHHSATANAPRLISPAMGRRVRAVNIDALTSNSDPSIPWLSVANRALDTLQGWQQQAITSNNIHSSPQLNAEQMESVVARAVERALGEYRADLAPKPPINATGISLLHTRRSTAAAQGAVSCKAKSGVAPSLANYIAQDLDACKSAAKEWLDDMSMNSSAFSDMLP